MDRSYEAGKNTWRRQVVGTIETHSHMFGTFQTRRYQSSQTLQKTESWRYTQYIFVVEEKSENDGKEMEAFLM